MRPHRRERHDALDRILGRREARDRGSDDPLQCIDTMDRLVHDRAAPVERLGALPAARAIVGIVPPPGHVTRRDRQRSEAAGRSGVVHRLHHGVEPLREDGAERHSRLTGGLQHLVDASERDLQRFLADDMHAMPGRGQNGVEMGA